MRPHPRSTRTLALFLIVLGVLLPGLIPLPASADPLKGYREDWPGTSLQDWGGGSLYDNPGTGGVDGVGDGFLLVWTPSPFNLGTVNLSPAYQGDWIAAGIQLVRVSLNDVGDAQPLSIHFLIADGYNVWQCKRSFIPLHNQWSEFTVDLTVPGDFVRLIGSGTFAQTLSNVDRIHFRHDLTPYVHSPDPIQGDFGIDRLILTNATTAAAPTTWGRIQRLYRDGD